MKLSRHKPRQTVGIRLEFGFKISYPDINPDRVSGLPTFAIEIFPIAETATIESGIGGLNRTFCMRQEAITTPNFYVTGISRSEPFRTQMGDNQQQSYVTEISRL